MPATISSIYRYPVKGLSPEPIASASLVTGGAIAGDRRFALALATTEFADETPEWKPKRAFLALVKNERLAALDTSFDETSEQLTVRQDGRQVACGKLTEPAGRATIEDFFAAYMGGEGGGKPRLVVAGEDIIFTDQKDKLLSIINLASIRELEGIVGQRIDPLRFRANIYIDGIEAWREFDWVDGEISAGEANLSVRKRIDRCAAINVNPDSGVRDQNLVKALQSGFGNIDMGVYARVTKGGKIALGEAIGSELNN